MQWSLPRCTYRDRSLGGKIQNVINCPRTNKLTGTSETTICAEPEINLRFKSRINEVKEAEFDLAGIMNKKPINKHLVNFYRTGGLSRRNRASLFCLRHEILSKDISLI